VTDKAAWLAEHLMGWEWKDGVIGSIQRPHWRRKLTGIWEEQNYLSTGDGMLEIIEAMRGRGFELYVDPIQVWFVKYDPPIKGISVFTTSQPKFGPAAVIEAAYEALKEKAPTRED